MVAALFALVTLAVVACGQSTVQRGGGGALSAADRGYWHFRSEPSLRPAALTITSPSPDASPPYLFLAPISIKGPPVGQTGPLIMDRSGNPVWVGSVPKNEVAMDFRVQVYQGRPVLTWWQGVVSRDGIGRGEGIIADSSYRVIARVHAGNGFQSDLHEFLLRPDGTAYVTVYRKVMHDLSAIGGPRRAPMWDSGVQQIDVASGRVLWQWDGLAHVPLTDSYARYVKGTNFDAYHFNSVDVGSDGTVLVSARHTWTVYAIDHTSGAVLWRLGGKRSSFTVNPGARFSWQHDARFRGPNLISVFDNATGLPPKQNSVKAAAAGSAVRQRSRSRAILVQLDTGTMSATLARSYSVPGVLASSQGNVQLLDNGRLFIGWGAQPWISEANATNTTTFRARFYRNDESYRTYAGDWTGTPRTRPAIAVRGSGGATTVYASWNGATPVSSWQVLGGATARRLSVIVTAPKQGFETPIRLRGAHAVYAVRALDTLGHTLGTSRIVRP